MRKNNKMEIDEESLQIYGLVQKSTEKLINQTTNFEELECVKSLNINQYKT